MSRTRCCTLLKSSRGFHLIEVLITVVVGTIVMFALTTPFVVERSFWATGKRQTEAQRDAQVAMRAIARAVRESSAYSFTAPATHTFTVPCGTKVFQLAGTANDQLQLVDNCPGGATTTIINGVRSNVASFSITSVIPNKLITVTLDVTHQLTATDPNQANELLVTELFLRNG